ncbi:Predicted metal-dependent phosphohydrolase, HD superfamily [Burkholderiales bacterium 8X]|nr:Predicted metal-dependent phosphohydrolase, HD superfamily [Burkholderiales bacterium 8X]
MTPGELHANWLGAWHALGVDSPDDGLFDALCAAYSEPHRAYHTLQHLGECLDHLSREAAAAERPAEVALALWFHDAFYDVHRGDNEQRSADWAAQAMIDAGVAREQAARVHRLVMATCHDVLPEGADAELLIDIDLAILGADTARFAEYERQIRHEYAHIAPDIFEPRRQGILGRFLARAPLYRTAPMRERLEAQARRNLATAISSGERPAA